MKAFRDRSPYAVGLASVVVIALLVAGAFAVGQFHLLEHTYEVYRRSHPWVSEDALSPKSVVRDMYERAMTFAEYVAFYGLARSEGLVLRYLGDAYRALRQTVPDSVRTDELDDTGREVVAASYDALSAIEHWSTAEIDEALRQALVEERGLKPRHAFGPVRIAVTGRKVSPPLFESLELLGRERSLARLRDAMSA